MEVHQNPPESTKLFPGTNNNTTGEEKHSAQKISKEEFDKNYNKSKQINQHIEKKYKSVSEIIDFAKGIARGFGNTNGKIISILYSGKNLPGEDLEPAFEMFVMDGMLHNDDGPAISFTDKDFICKNIYMNRNRLHSLTGPAAEYSDESLNFYAISNYIISRSIYDKEIADMQEYEFDKESNSYYNSKKKIYRREFPSLFSQGHDESAPFPAGGYCLFGNLVSKEDWLDYLNKKKIKTSVYNQFSSSMKEGAKRNATRYLFDLLSAAIHKAILSSNIQDKDKIADAFNSPISDILTKIIVGFFLPNIEAFNNIKYSDAFARECRIQAAEAMQQEVVYKLFEQLSPSIIKSINEIDFTDEVINETIQVNQNIQNTANL